MGAGGDAVVGLMILFGVYALALMGGGAAGWARARSRPSLVVGIVSGVFAAAAAVLIGLHHPRSGLGLGAALSLMMAVWFAGRWRMTGRAMPAAPIVGLSVVVLAASVVRLGISLARHV